MSGQANTLEWLEQVDPHGGGARSRRLQPVAIVGLSLLFVSLWAGVGALAGAVLLALLSGGPNASTDPSNAALLSALLAGAAVGFAPAALWALHVWRAGAGMAVRSVFAVAADPDHDRQLLNVVEELSVAAGVRPPQALVVHAPVLNAFSVSGRRGSGAIVVTSGMLHELTREELAAVVAHEMIHLRDRDGVLPLFAGVLVGWLLEVTAVALGQWRVAILWPVCWLVAGLALGFRALALRRQAEITDLASIQLTRDPSALVDALRKMAASDRTLRRGTVTVDRLLFVPPCERRATALRNGATEPAGVAEIQRRIDRLERLGARSA